MPLTDETRVAAREIMARYPRPRSALLPMLHLVQSEEGYVTPEGVRFCADELGLTKAEVGAVATFYTMYKRRPTGEYLVSVCTNTLCDVLGGRRSTRRCPSSSASATTRPPRTGGSRSSTPSAWPPATTRRSSRSTTSSSTSRRPTRRPSWSSELRAGRRPLPTRGAPLCTFKEISRQLAGFIDERPGAVDAASAGEPTLVGTRLAVRAGRDGAGVRRADPARQAGRARLAAAGAGRRRAGRRAARGRRRGRRPGCGGGRAPADRRPRPRPSSRRRRHVAVRRVPGPSRPAAPARACRPRPPTPRPTRARTRSPSRPRRRRPTPTRPTANRARSRRRTGRRPRTAGARSGARRAEPCR